MLKWAAKARYFIAAGQFVKNLTSPDRYRGYPSNSGSKNNAK